MSTPNITRLRVMLEVGQREKVLLCAHILSRLRTPPRPGRSNLIPGRQVWVQVFVPIIQEPHS